MQFYCILLCVCVACVCKAKATTNKNVIKYRQAASSAGLDSWKHLCVHTSNANDFFKISILFCCPIFSYGFISIYTLYFAPTLVLFSVPLKLGKTRFNQFFSGCKVLQVGCISQWKSPIYSNFDYTFPFLPVYSHFLFI